MPLRLEYRAPASVPVEIDGITPDRLAGVATAEIARRNVYCGNQQVALGDLFQVSGTLDEPRIDFVGDLAGVHRIGAKLAYGEIHIHGSAGRHVGSEMTGGAIHVSGDAGDWLGAEVHDGLIHVRGRAGDLVGAAYRGSTKGMTGGMILVDGATGNEIGHTMRRGLIAVGSTGDFAAISMIAGSVFVFGRCGERPAAGMRRGTLTLLGDEAPRLLPTFQAAEIVRPGFMRVYLRAIAQAGMPFDAALFDSAYRLYHGDMLDSGRGEILIRER